MGGHKGLAAATCCTTAPNRAVHSATATRKEAVAAPDLPWLQRATFLAGAGVSARDRDECGGGSGPSKGGRTPHSAYFSRRGNLQWPEHAKRLSRNIACLEVQDGNLGLQHTEKKPPSHRTHVTSVAARTGHLQAKQGLQAATVYLNCDLNE